MESVNQFAKIRKRRSESTVIKTSGVAHPHLVASLTQVRLSVYLQPGFKHQNSH